MYSGRYGKKNNPNERAWHRLPDEEQAAWELFKLFLTLKGDRGDTKKVAQLTGLSPNTVYVYASAYSWTERRRAFREWESMAKSLLVEQQKIVRTRVIEVGSSLHDLITRRVNQIKDSGDIDSKEIASLVTSLEKLDNILRRAAELPSNYKPAVSSDGILETYELGD